MAHFARVGCVQFNYLLNELVIFARLIRYNVLLKLQYETIEAMLKLLIRVGFRTFSCFSIQYFVQLFPSFPSFCSVPHTPVFICTSPLILSSPLTCYSSLHSAPPFPVFPIILSTPFSLSLFYSTCPQTNKSWQLMKLNLSTPRRRIHTYVRHTRFRED